MKNISTSIGFLVLGIALGILLSNYMMVKYPTAQVKQSLAAKQLVRYKEAKEICGPKNVEQICPESSHCDKSTVFTCTDWNIASLSQEQRKGLLNDHLNEKLQSYCNKPDFVKNYYEDLYRYFY